MTRFIDANGARLAVADEGTGEPVLLLHAGIADQTMWDDDARALARTRRVVRLDHRGYGASTMPKGPFSYPEDARAALDALGIARADVVGVSMSATVALRLALDHPERVRRLVLVGGGHPDVDWPDDLTKEDEEEERALARGDVDAATDVNLRMWVWGRGRGPDAYPAERRESVVAMVHRAVSRANERQRGTPQRPPITRADLARLAAPTLVMVGDHDVPPIVESARKYAADIPGARLAVMRGTAHLPNLEKPDEFRKHVAEHLAKTT